MVYILRSDGTLCRWEGMLESEVLDMLALQDLTGTILTEAEYNAAITALQA